MIPWSELLWPALALPDHHYITTPPTPLHQGRQATDDPTPAASQHHTYHSELFSWALLVKHPLNTGPPDYPDPGSRIPEPSTPDIANSADEIRRRGSREEGKGTNVESSRGVIPGNSGRFSYPVVPAICPTHPTTSSTHTDQGCSVLHESKMFVTGRLGCGPRGGCTVLVRTVLVRTVLSVPCCPYRTVSVDTAWPLLHCKRLYGLLDSMYKYKYNDRGTSIAPRLRRTVPSHPSPNSNQSCSGHGGI